MSTGWRAGLRACIACIALWCVGVHATTTCTYFGDFGGKVLLRGTAALERQVASWVNVPWARPSTICTERQILEPQDWEPWEAPCFTDGGTGVSPPFVTQTGYRLEKMVSPLPTDPSTGAPLPYERYARPLFAVQTNFGGDPGPATGMLAGKPQPVASCETFPTVIGFFNGVWTTEQGARNNLDELAKAFGETRDQTPLTYQVFYNHTGCGRENSKLGCMEDVFEVFEQRNRELGGGFGERFEFAWELAFGTQEDPESHSGNVLLQLGKQGAAFIKTVRSFATKVVAKLLAGAAKAIANPPTAQDEATHVAQLLDMHDKKMGAVLVAHSQGNLFANSAYDAIMKQRPDALVKVVHVAPASPTLRGEYVLADTDIVINGMRALYMGGLPPNNISIPTDKADISTHAFVDTYMDRNRGARSRVIDLIGPALDGI